ncbi:MAG: gloB [Paucimonas sp.]|nr:gloB [Paucimonas sp.]
MSIKSPVSVLPVPAFSDNYLWLVHDDRHAVVVDPGAAEPVLAALEANQLALSAILLTHHHADHAGGVPALLQRFDVPVYGPASEAIPTITQRLREGDTVTIDELSLTFSVLDVPGHTAGHIAYYCAQNDWLFCGDTLFAGGCGRLFEGTPAQMVDSLAKLAALPDRTQVYCAHEYTLSNLRFAAAVDGDNPALKERIAVEEAKRARNQPTVPSTIGLEKQTNPFLRHTDPAIVDRLLSEQRISSREPIAAFAALRESKNSFR